MQMDVEGHRVWQTVRTGVRTVDVPIAQVATLGLMLSGRSKVGVITTRRESGQPSESNMVFKIVLNASFPVFKICLCLDM